MFYYIIGIVAVAVCVCVFVCVCLWYYNIHVTIEYFLHLQAHYRFVTCVLSSAQLQAQIH